MKVWGEGSPPSPPFPRLISLYCNTAYHFNQPDNTEHTKNSFYKGGEVAIFWFFKTYIFFCSCFLTRISQTKCWTFLSIQTIYKEERNWLYASNSDFFIYLFLKSYNTDLLILHTFTIIVWNIRLPWYKVKKTRVCCE